MRERTGDFPDGEQSRANIDAGQREKILMNHLEENRGGTQWLNCAGYPTSGRIARPAKQLGDTSVNNAG